MKQKNDTYNNLYNSDLKHMEKNLARFVKEKKRTSLSNRQTKSNNK